MNIEEGTLRVYSVEANGTFKWNHHNRLTEFASYREYGLGVDQEFDGPGVQVTLSLNATSEYVYDVLDQLVAVRRYDGLNPTPEIEGYVIERGSRVIEFRKDAAGAYRVLGRLNAAAVDQVLAVDGANYTADWAQVTVPRTTWALTDRQGTVRDLVGEQGGSMVHESIDYNAFGVPLGGGGLQADVSALYAGREYDAYSHLYNNRARWYDAAMQRFISEDPMGFAGGDANLYRYCGNSPVNATDPSGLESALWAFTSTLATSFVGNIYEAGRSLVTGDAGRALGARVVAISERHGDGQFNGNAGDWGNFAMYSAGEILGVDAIYEGLSGSDLATGQTLTGYERVMRGVQGTATLSGWAAGGLGIASRFAGPTFFATRALPGSALVSRLTAPLTAARGSMAASIARVIPRGLKNAGNTASRILNTDLGELAGRVWARNNARAVLETGIAPGGLYDVGEYSALRMRVAEPGLNAHHIGQKALMKRYIPGYDPHCTF